MRLRNEIEDLEARLDEVNKDLAKARRGIKLARYAAKDSEKVLETKIEDCNEVNESLRDVLKQLKAETAQRVGDMQTNIANRTKGEQNEKAKRVAAEIELKGCKQKIEGWVNTGGRRDEQKIQIDGLNAENAVLKREQDKMHTTVGELTREVENLKKRLGDDADEGDEAGGGGGHEDQNLELLSGTIWDGDGTPLPPVSEDKGGEERMPSTPPAGDRGGRFRGKRVAWKKKGEGGDVEEGYNTVDVDDVKLPPHDDVAARAPHISNTHVNLEGEIRTSAAAEPALDARKKQREERGAEEEGGGGGPEVQREWMTHKMTPRYFSESEDDGSRRAYVADDPLLNPNANLNDLRDAYEALKGEKDNIQDNINSLKIIELYDEAKARFKGKKAKKAEKAFADLERFEKGMNAHSKKIAEKFKHVEELERQLREYQKLENKSESDKFPIYAQSLLKQLRSPTSTNAIESQIFVLRTHMKNLKEKQQSLRLKKDEAFEKWLSANGDWLKRNNYMKGGGSKKHQKKKKNLTQKKQKLKKYRKPRKPRKPRKQRKPNKLSKSNKSNKSSKPSKPNKPNKSRKNRTQKI